MSTYKVYRSPTGGIVRVKVGFSWQACFVGSFSALVRQVWLIVGVGLVFFLSEAWFTGAPAPTSRTAALGLALFAASMVYMVFCGIHGNRWLCDSLRRRSHTLIGEEKRPMLAGLFKRGAAKKSGRSARRTGAGPAVSQSAPL